ncbi:MAG TPA: Gfo/Idh/MocA family oxidoreductase [Fimbriimonadaceae bacterium]|nr:Gfo/Idh/MocA family oxidoreductase [Fimbriimonadaceae bacterium]
MAKRLAWIGTAHIHTPGFTNEVLKRGFACAGVWDHDADRAKKNAEKLGGPVGTVLQFVQDAGVNGFVVCSETVRHLELVGQLVGAGKPIFIEKPMGFDEPQSRAILKLLEDHKIVFQTGYFSRGLANVRALKKKVDEGFFGTVTRVRASNCHSGALGHWFDTDWRWMADRKQAGVGAFGDLGTHVLDLLLWIFGPVSSVTGILANGTARYEGCEELGEALLKFENGILGTLAASWDDVADPIRIQVAGTKGHALLGADLQVAGPDGKFEKIDTGEGVPAGFNAFLDYLEGRQVELVTPREAAQRDIVMDTIYRAAESRKWLDVA